MKLRFLLTVAFSLWAGTLSAQTTPTAAVAGRPVLWAVHFDAERLRTGAGKKLFASVDPALLSLSSGNAPGGGKLESLALFGLQPQKDGGDGFPLVADLAFSAEGGGIGVRFEAVGKKHGVPIESVGGYPTIHFPHQGKEVWIAKRDDTRVIVSTSRRFLETALAGGADGAGAALSQTPGEVLGGFITVESLLADHPALRDSELFKLLQHLDFHVLSGADDQLDLAASADVDSERSAKRAVKIVDGMVAAFSLRDASGVPWDERLTLKQDGPRLAMGLHLEPGEARALFDLLAHEINDRMNPSKDE